MNNGIKMPNCCYVCLQKPQGYLSLTNKKVKFKELQNSDGYLNTFMVSTYYLPICRSCKRKDRIFKIIITLLSFFLPFIPVLLIMPHGMNNEATVEGAQIITIVYTVILFIAAIIIFKLRNSFGLGKRDFLKKTLEFRNKDYSGLYNEVNS